MASYTKTVDIVDSLVSERSYGGGSFIRSPTMIWRSNNRSDFFVPLPRSDKLYVSWMNELGTSGTGHANESLFLPDWGAIPAGKRVLTVELFFYARNDYPHTIDFIDSGLQTTSKGWNNIVTTISYRIPNSPSQNYLWLKPLRNLETIRRWLEIDSHTGANKPYAIITYEDVAPKEPINLYPDKNIVSGRNVTRFSWEHKSEEYTKQKEFTLQYSTNNGSAWTTINRVTSNQYYDMPANTLPLESEVLWRVKTKDQNNLESPYTKNIRFNTEVVPQKAPTLTTPLTGYLDGSEVIVLEWDFRGGSAEDKQGKYDLQYSLDRGGSWTTIKETSTSKKHTISPNTFQSGNVYWRVRTYTTYGDVSPYSEIGSFNIVNSPPIPQVSDVSNSSKPLISWISVEQQVYEIEILENGEIIYRTGSIPSSEKEHRVNIFLNDGNYTARLRVTNEFSLKSPWAEKSFTISTVKPPKPIMEVYSSGYTITIKSSSEGVRNLVYRDNILIGELENNIFIDYTGINNKEHKYFIRAVDEDENFSDSDVKVAKCKFKGNTLAAAENPGNFIKLKHGFNSIPRKVNSISISGTLQYYDGRKYPVAEYSEFESNSKSLSFILKNKLELDALINLISKRKTLLYRDSDGENIYGSAFEIDFEKNMLGYYEVGFTITRTEE